MFEVKSKIRDGKVATVLQYYQKAIKRCDFWRYFNCDNDDYLTRKLIYEGAIGVDSDIRVDYTCSVADLLGVANRGILADLSVIRVFIKNQEAFDKCLSDVLGIDKDQINDELRKEVLDKQVPIIMEAMKRWEDKEGRTCARLIMDGIPWWCEMELLKDID